MIPYFQFTRFSIGPIPIQVWGLFVATGIALALFLSSRAARKKNLDTTVLIDGALWIVVIGFLSARIAHVLLYDPTLYISHPKEILAIWHGGFSSIGGFIGGALAGVWYFRRKKVDIGHYTDAIAFGLPWGWMIGRIGCFLIHDHPGTLTHFVLAVRQPGQDIERHDLGLYDALLALGIGIVYLLTQRRWREQGRGILLVGMLYSVPRFFLDFLRATDLPLSDARYFFLTPAQYGMIFLLLFSLYSWRRISIQIKKGRVA